MTEKYYHHKVHVPSKVEGWYAEHIDPAELDKKITATLDYLKRVKDEEDGTGYTVWAHELVSGKHGVYTTRIFLDELLCHGFEVYMAMELNEVIEDELMERYDDTTRELARLFARHSKLPGDFYVGNNEADGSLGVFYTGGAL